MTDKEQTASKCECYNKKDHCSNCDVEPPAMKFKCPECEHNPDKEQIIIDGVDVSGCEAYSKHREGYCGWHTPCEGDSCSYKLDWALDQLKRKEQECEELKSLLKVRIEDLCDSCGASSMMPMPCKVYEKILAEIKEIAEKYNNTHLGEQQYCCKDILQKISEYEVNND